MARLFKLVTPLIGLTLAIGSTNSAWSQELPQLRQGEPYRNVRQQMIANGWQKVSLDRGPWSDRCKSSNTPKVCYLYPEFMDASIDGYCLYQWSNVDGRILKISTENCGGRFQSTSESDPGRIMGWEWQTQ